MPIPPEYLDEAGVIAYDDSLTTDERRERLGSLLADRPELEGSIKGYMEMLSNLDNIDDGE